MTLAMDDVAIIDDRGGSAPSSRDRSSITALTRAGAPPPRFAAMPVATLLAEARAPATLADADEPDLIKSRRRLDDRERALQREITSKQHERAAYAGASLVAVLCGCVAALRRQGALPLTTYLWSFFPALGAVITIGAGQGLTHAVGAPGLVLLWGGVAALSIYTALEFSRLCRH
ncbi:MAG TPA: hypothetical protein DEB06_00340 [Phycisphaerales bacterium]|nr:hypothetical protein [Phycisphaerales bacterium]